MRGTVFVEGATQPTAVDVSVDAHRVRGVSDDGTEWTIALSDCSVHAGGFDGCHVFVRTPDDSITISTAHADMVPALLAVADERLRDMLADVGLHRSRHTRLRNLGIASVVTLVTVSVVAVLAGVYFGPRALVSSVEELPISVDRQLGDAASGELGSLGAPLDDPLVVGFVEQIVRRLEPHAAVAGFEYRVRVVRSEEVNAFALPGGQIVVLTGLIEQADRPEQVAGVLAHEISHVTLRHGIRNVAHDAGIYVAASILLGDASGWAELAAQMAVLAQHNDYSREQESAADAEGVRMLLAAGIDPSGLSEFFEHLQSQPGSELTGAMNWLSTHPDHASRIAHVEALSRTLPAAPRRPIVADWPAIQAAAR